MTLKKLHNLPTRRSSDLKSRQQSKTVRLLAWSKFVCISGSPCIWVEHHSKGSLSKYIFWCTGAPFLRSALKTVGPLPGHRSEEHTSELQSHSDLVCRLLL